MCPKSSLLWSPPPPGSFISLKVIPTASTCCWPAVVPCFPTASRDLARFTILPAPPAKRSPSSPYLHPEQPPWPERGVHMRERLEAGPVTPRSQAKLKLRGD